MQVDAGPVIDRFEHQRQVERTGLAGFQPAIGRASNASGAEWTYEVTNTGNVPNTDIRVTDDQGVAVSCPSDTLAPGQSMTCTGSGTAVVGQPLKLQDGTFQFPVKARADEVQIRLINDSPYPSNFLSVDWEGFYKSRSQRI